MLPCLQEDSHDFVMWYQVRTRNRRNRETARVHTSVYTDCPFGSISAALSNVLKLAGATILLWKSFLTEKQCLFISHLYPPTPNPSNLNELAVSQNPKICLVPMGRWTKSFEIGNISQVYPSLCVSDWLGLFNKPRPLNISIMLFSGLKLLVWSSKLKFNLTQFFFL